MWREIVCPPTCVIIMELVPRSWNAPLMPRVISYCWPNFPEIQNVNERRGGTELSGSPAIIWHAKRFLVRPSCYIAHRA